VKADKLETEFVIAGVFEADVTTPPETELVSAGEQVPDTTT